MNDLVSSHLCRRMRVACAAFMLLPIPTLAQGNGTFTEPNSALLFGKFGGSLYVVTRAKTIELANVTEGGIPAVFRVPGLLERLIASPGAWKEPTILRSVCTP
jgi:hypothetical protein